MRWLRDPPRALTAVVFAALAALLVYPIHRPYLHPDQDVLPTLPLVQMARHTWSPLILMYGSALPNLLHLFDAALLRVGRLAGWWQTPTDLLVAWCDAPWLFRIPPRALAMAGGLAALVAARGIAAILTDRLTALAAPLLLGTWLLFVREHHHGWYDGPAAGLAMLALWAATSYVRTPRIGRLVAAAACAGLAASCKFNLLMVVPAVLTAALAAPTARRVATAMLAGAVAFVAFAATTPEVVLEAPRLFAYLPMYVRVQGTVLTHAAGDGGNRLLEILSLGVGWPGLVAAAVGLVVALRRRDRALVPLLTFVALYGLVLVRTPLALGRYVLPFTGPMAVLAAYAIGMLPPLARVAVVVGVVALDLPACLDHVRLLASDDTRVEAARFVEDQWSRGQRVLVAANPVLASYVGPDLPQLLRYEGGLPADVTAALVARAPRCVRPVEVLSSADKIAAAAGAYVVTIDPPAPDFARAATPPDVLAALERDATLVVDLLVDRTPAPRRYEIFDLHYVPLGGMASIRRAGPRLRVWRVPEQVGHAPPPGS